jgi:DNA polymerase-3 subunit epsilon
MAATFVALDVETANADQASICQIGAVRVEGGTIAATMRTLINPQDYFDPMNISIHGITEEMVEDAPCFAEVAPELSAFIGADVVACHTAFDRVALDRVHTKYQLEPPEWPWLDTARVCRRAWPDKFAHAGYGLANVAAFCGVEFRHHDALEDARAAALVLLHAMDHVGLDLDGWQRRIRQPIFPRPGGHGDSVACDGDPDGPLAGEVIVFTGALVMTRAEAAPTAAALGCNVRDTVTKATTILVVGLQDASKLKGYEKSSKHRKAETMIRGGAPLRILSEQDFMGLTRMLDAVPA